jgi:hypothetical protein
VKSLVYQSPTAALHSSVSRLRKRRRKLGMKALQISGTSIPGLISSWLKKPIPQRKLRAQPAPTMPGPRVIPDPKTEFSAEILGVILEMKHEAS